MGIGMTEWHLCAEPDMAAFGRHDLSARVWYDLGTPGVRLALRLDWLCPNYPTVAMVMQKETSDGAPVPRYQRAATCR